MDAMRVSEETAYDVTHVTDWIPFWTLSDVYDQGSTRNLAVHDIVKAFDRIRLSCQSTAGGDLT